MSNFISARLPTIFALGDTNLIAQGTEGNLSALATDTTLMTIFGCMVLLLLGILFRMRQLRIEIEQESTALRESESHFRRLGDNLPSITLFQLTYTTESKTFRFAYISQGYERILGLERTRLLDDAQLALDHIYEDDLAILQQAFHAGLERQEPCSMEIRVLDVDGRYKWLHISAIPQRVEDTLVWDGFMQDISSAKEAEQTAREEHRNFQHLFETIDDLLIVCDMDGKILHANPATGQRLGYTDEELVSMSIFELYPKEHQEAIFTTVAQLRTTKAGSCGCPIQMKNGAVILAETNLFQGTWKHEQALFGVARDVARHQQTESALRESRKMLQLIIDTIPMSIFWKDKDSMYLGCNEAFTQGCRVDSQADVLGKSPIDLFDSDMAERMVTRDQEVIRLGQAILNRSDSYTRPDGSLGQLDISLMPLRDATGKAVGVMGIWRDVTDQNQSEDRLKRTLDDMERFNQLMRGRERRTLELKDEINELMLELGRPKKYRTTSEDMT